MVPSLRGKLLVATPSLGDPNFDRTVIFMLEHGAEGALGIVLNRPTDTPLSEAVSDWAPLASPPAVVYLGGPVGIGTIIALGRTRDEDDSPAGTEPVTGPLVSVDLSADPDALVPRLTDLRVWTGYAGWAGGQIEAELAQEAWFVVDAEASDATTLDPGGALAHRARPPTGDALVVQQFPRGPRPQLSLVALAALAAPRRGTGGTEAALLAPLAGSAIHARDEPKCSKSCGARRGQCAKRPSP